MIEELKLEDLESLKELYEESFNIDCDLKKMKKSYVENNNKIYE